MAQNNEGGEERVPVGWDVCVMYQVLVNKATVLNDCILFEHEDLNTVKQYGSEMHKIVGKLMSTKHLRPFCCIYITTEDGTILEQYGSR